MRVVATLTDRSAEIVARISKRGRQRAQGTRCKGATVSPKWSRDSHALSRVICRSASNEIWGQIFRACKQAHGIWSGLGRG